MAFYTAVLTRRAKYRTLTGRGPVRQRHFVGIALAALALLALGTPQARPGFKAPLSFDAGSNPLTVAVGDFNGDGIPDLVVGNEFGSNTVSVCWAREMVPSGRPSTYTAGTGPISATMADLNGDDILDLAVANVGNVVSVAGNGDGTFQAAVNTPPAAPSSPWRWPISTVTAIPDLAVANEGMTKTTRTAASPCCWATATALCPAAVNYAAADRLTAVAVGDFNRDGIPTWW